MPGLAKQYGKAPGASTGNYQKHLNSKLGFTDLHKKLFTIDCPTTSKLDGSREKYRMALLAPHEALEEIIAADESFDDKLQEAFVDDELPLAYWNNPLVKDSEQPVVPLGIFMDGVAYTEHDSVVGIWLISLVNDDRCLLGAVRKNITCSCGCHGWCTWKPIHEFLHWSLLCMAEGRMPRVGPMGRGIDTRTERQSKPGHP